MDSNQNNFYKKQRNQKKQRDNVKAGKDSAPKAANPNLSNAQEGSDPQPQRANRRERNVQKTSNVETPPKIEQDNKETATPTVVDHSHLKRETEEIEKYNKKFSKREVSSNWHRYSATEITPGETQAEEETLADFAELLQVTSSRGGHLKLKEEQDWSQASGAELSSYFSLDLRTLSESLASIPMYELLQLPKQIFSEEELNSFDSKADQAKKAYSSRKTQDPGAMVLSLLTNLVLEQVESKETDLLSKDPENFDLENNSHKLITLDKMGLEFEKLNESVPKAVQKCENETKPTNLNKECVDLIVKQTKEESIENISSHTKLLLENSKGLIIEDDNKHKKDNSQLNHNNSDSIQMLNANPKAVKSTNSPSTINTKISSEKETVLLEPGKNPLLQTKSHIDNDQPSIKTSDKNSHLLRKKSLSPVKDLKATKNIELSKDNRLEDDDDDLDFLLQLKTPISNPSTKDKNDSEVTIKDSSFLPGGGQTTCATAVETRSELDNWLDSVLED